MARKEKQEPKQSLGQFWTAEIQSAGKEFEKWEERAHKIVRRYRDDRDAVDSRIRKFNILWSNVQVMKPALYGRMPKPEVSRRFRDADPVGRTAALMLERCLEFEVEQYPDFQRTMRCAVEDRLLPGRGVAWIRYEPHFVGDDQTQEITQVTTPEQPGTITDDERNQLEYECAPTDYVHWKDFLHEPARTWEEVSWVARRVYMDVDEGTKRFGDIFALVPMQSEDTKRDVETPKHAKKKKGEVWEIWDKTKKQVVWVAKGFDRELDVRPDPLGLEQFFPCPMPLYATVTTGSLVPVPDYCEYQDQAEELDILTARISRLTKAVKVVGVYNAEFIALKRMLQEGVDNELIPVDTWAAFAEKRGLAGAVEFLPMKEVIETLVRLYEAREQAKQIIYETIGISDILRGQSDAGETLGAQQLKAQFGTMRLRQSQEDVARFATDLLRMKAHVICKFFSDETILKMSGVEFTLDKDLAIQALQLLRGGPLKDFRIEVSADTLAQIDDDKDKAERMELIAATGEYFKNALPLVQSFPQAGALVGELLMFGIRGFKVGKAVEAAFERAMAQIGQALQQQKGPDPVEQMKLEAEKVKAQGEQMRMQGEAQILPLKIQAEREKSQAAIQKANIGVQKAEIGMQTAMVKAMQPEPVQGVQ